MPDTLWGVVVGGLLAGVVALGSQVLAARSHAAAAREANRQQERVWQRDQRLEAHQAFLNQVNRLVHAIGVIEREAGTPDADLRLVGVAESLKTTVDAFNRVELVCSPQMYELAVKILAAANAQRLQNPAEFPAVMQAIGEASRKYREAAKAEVRA